MNTITKLNRELARHVIAYNRACMAGNHDGMTLATKKMNHVRNVIAEHKASKG